MNAMRLPCLRRLALALLLALAAPAMAKAPPPAGMVSAADPRAAAAGTEILRAGGNATDAALAVMLALTVVEPQSSGIGGGGFLLHGDSKGQIEAIDGREIAPASADGQWFMADGLPMPFRQVVPGGKSVGVPGAVALAATAHRRHGKMRWARLFQPAIRLAQDGFEITPRLHATLARARRSGAFDADARALYYGPDGEPLPVGTRIRNPALAAFLTRLAKEGPRAFYTGANARAVAAEVRAAPAAPAEMSEADLAGYSAVVREPLCGMYRQWRICGMGPPSAGATTVFAILKQLERFDLAALGAQSPTAWHLIAESMRLAYADRARWIGDADFVSVPATGLMDPAYLASRSALIDPDKAMLLALPGTPPGARQLVRAAGSGPEEQGTTHFVTVDRNGNTVSFTNTIEGPFGSGLMVNGYFLNNELTDFSFAPAMDGRPVANAVGPRKRPRSSMAPTLVHDGNGRLRLAVGAAGGATIPAQVAKAIIGVLDWGLSAREAIALPVLFAPGATVFVEKGTAHEAMIPALIALGHGDVRAREASFKANAIEATPAGWQGAADPRSEGAAVAP